MEEKKEIQVIKVNTPENNSNVQKEPVKKLSYNQKKKLARQKKAQERETQEKQENEIKKNAEAQKRSNEAKAANDKKQALLKLVTHLDSNNAVALQKIEALLKVSEMLNGVNERVLTPTCNAYHKLTGMLNIAEHPAQVKTTILDNPVSRELLSNVISMAGVVSSIERKYEITQRQLTSSNFEEKQKEIEELNTMKKDALGSYFKITSDLKDTNKKYFDQGFGNKYDLEEPKDEKEETTTNNDADSKVDSKEEIKQEETVNVEVPSSTKKNTKNTAA